MYTCAVRMLAGVRVVCVVLMRVVVLLCAVDGARVGGGGPAPGVRSLGRALQLIEEEFEEVGLVFWR